MWVSAPLLDLMLDVLAGFFFQGRNASDVPWMKVCSGQI